ANRAECYLRLERPLEALRDAQAVLRRNRSHEKCLVRRAKALVMLRFKEAIACCGEDGRAIARLTQEYHHGQYDESALEREARFGEQAVHADFFARNCVNFASNCIGGRGIRATQAMAPNTLLMATKAFAFLPASSSSPIRENVLHKL